VKNDRASLSRPGIKSLLSLAVANRELQIICLVMIAPAFWFASGTAAASMHRRIDRHRSGG
jgi:hypothetical protein